MHDFLEMYNYIVVVIFHSLMIMDRHVNRVIHFAVNLVTCRVNLELTTLVEVQNSSLKLKIILQVGTIVSRHYA